MLIIHAPITTTAAFFRPLFVPVRHRSFRTIRDLMEKGHVPFSEEDYAFNNVEKKKGLLKPRRTVEEQIEYMSSEAFRNVYKDRPVWETWVRNLRNQIKYQPPLRLFCIDRNGRFNVNHACPVCRDEYFFFDYRNTALMKQFLVAGTALPITNKKTSLCIVNRIVCPVRLYSTVTASEPEQRKYRDPKVALDRAREELEEEEYQQASYKAWLSVDIALKRLAERKGMKIKYLHAHVAKGQFASHLAKKYGKEITMCFDVAGALHENSYEGNLKMEQIEERFDIIEELFQKLEEVERECEPSDLKGFFDKKEEDEKKRKEKKKEKQAAKKAKKAKKLEEEAKMGEKLAQEEDAKKAVEEEEAKKEEATDECKDD